MLVNEIIRICTKNHKNPISTNCSITDFKAYGTHNYHYALKS
jgi:hypothetical protein